MAVPACPLTCAGICASWLNSDASAVCMGLSFATPENKCSLPSREAKKWREKYMDRMTSSAQSAKRTNPSVRLLCIYESPSRIPTLVTALLPGAAGCLDFAVNEATERRSPAHKSHLLPQVTCRSSHLPAARIRGQNGNLLRVFLKATVPRHGWFFFFSLSSGKCAMKSCIFSFLCNIFKFVEWDLW